ncbi:hypothetical protein [Glycomyces xiaoerkulensis]|uniref:hypothetical protein n=1 Tax=Glycomyces xiaoerkulensis TaxID=2038139 RepID=UPI0012FFD494|nr:hypothetical protein [Glycomyces xiaoerkulensis]
MSELATGMRALGIADPEAAIAAHAVLGSDPGLLAHAGRLPATLGEVPDWVKATVLNPGNPLFGIAERAVAEALGEEPDERVDRLLDRLTIRPRTARELSSVTGFEDLGPTLEHLAEAGLVRAHPNPLEPDDPFWMMTDRPARFYYAVMAEHLPRWRRGYITDRLWRMTHARFDRYVCRAEFADLAREWALGAPGAVAAARIVVPDPRHRQMRTLEVAAWNADGEPVALGTLRWGLLMHHRQLRRLRHVRRLLGDPPASLVCIAPRVDGGIAADEDPNLFRVGPAHLLKG